MRLVQRIANDTLKPLIVNLELATARYRIDAGEELYLYYDSDSEAAGPLTPTRVSLIDVNGRPELIVWASENFLCLRDGTEAPLYYEILSE